MTNASRHLIDQSILEQTAPRVRWTQTLEDALLADCDGNTETQDCDGNTVLDIWGTRADGAEWRVELVKRPTYRATDREIRALLREAATAGDAEQVRLCRIALGEEYGDDYETAEGAREACSKVIAQAQAQEARR